MHLHRPARRRRGRWSATTRITVDDVLADRAGRDRALARALHARTRPGSASTWYARLLRRSRPSASASACRPSARPSAAPSCARPCRCTARSRRSSIGDEAVFRGINGPFSATRYHSLIVDRDTCPTDLAVTAETGDGLDHGPVAPHPADPRRAVPPGKHPVGARRHDHAQFLRSRGSVERQAQREPSARQRAAHQQAETHGILQVRTSPRSRPARR